MVLLIEVQYHNDIIDIIDIIVLKGNRFFDRRHNNLEINNKIKFYITRSVAEMPVNNLGNWSKRLGYLYL